ncbi:hypothetical protein GDO78_001119 [Eleutherodactylus coqui]|uniref:Uncharacterized protein n=1 Tax=Eleutherodactylus coqui TaxID=57060 RepID=A0A8J6FSK6_ELECQ|nr:hypothetical protein GDO78_001119 [Eleutherodactylus coqui]
MKVHLQFMAVLEEGCGSSRWLQDSRAFSCSTHWKEAKDATDFKIQCHGCMTKDSSCCNTTLCIVCNTMLCIFTIF